MARRARPCSLILFALFFLQPDPVEACSCAFSGPPCQAFWTTDAVFDATVASIEVIDPPDPRPELLIGRENLVKLHVREAWKDGKTGPLEVVTNLDGASCGFSFQVGKRYLVFVRKRQFDGRWTASLCSATREYDGTGETAAFLASLAHPPAGGRVFGAVKFTDRDLLSGAAEERNVETRVRLFGDVRERVAVSGGGRFEFAGLAPGSYRVEIDVPDGYSAYKSDRDVVIPNGYACSQQDYWLSHGGRIAGRAIGHDGVPVRHLRVEATHRDARSDAYGFLAVQQASARPDGSFEIVGLAPGPYILGVNLEDRSPSEVNPFVRTVFPSDGPDPYVITLSAGQTIDVGTWRLPPPLRPVRIEGVITWKDGTPAVSIFVTAFDRTGNTGTRLRYAAGGQSDANGRFTIDLREGRVYTFEAGDGRGARLRITAPKILTAGPPEPIRIVIQQERPGDR